MNASEINFDGLVGPTHNYAGLSYGNMASQSNQGEASQPRAAALQGLEKTKRLAQLGVGQGYFPPQARPDFRILRQMGFTGTDRQLLEQGSRHAKWIVASCYSASSMWAANAATVAPSADTQDGRVHFTPANLGSTLHRSLEPEATSRMLQRVFPDMCRFHHHPSLPAKTILGDEGAANHTCFQSEEARVQLFVYGRSVLHPERGPSHFPARQSLEASQAVARLHQLDPRQVVFAEQNPAAIDAGVFHNDVIAVGYQNVLLYHELAFRDETEVLRKLNETLNGQLIPIRIPLASLSLKQAVHTYLFNSQIISTPNGHLALIAPSECEDLEAARKTIDEVLGASDNPIDAIHYFDVRQSMHNGGGPACLRLRVSLTAEEQAAVLPSCLYSDARHEALATWIRQHYREQLAPEDLMDPNLIDEVHTALDELTRILALGSDFYPFQW